MIEECDCSVREKRKRIVESLKGPALEIIQAVRLNDPDASPEYYVEALESAFGAPESGEDIFCFQVPTPTARRNAVGLLETVGALID